MELVATLVIIHAKTTFSNNSRRRALPLTLLLRIPPTAVILQQYLALGRTLTFPRTISQQYRLRFVQEYLRYISRALYYPFFFTFSRDLQYCNPNSGNYAISCRTATAKKIDSQKQSMMFITLVVSRFLRQSEQQKQCDYQLISCGLQSTVDRQLKRKKKHRLFYKNILTASAASSTNLGSILIFASCVLYRSPVLSKFHQSKPNIRLCLLIPTKRRGLTL